MEPYIWGDAHVTYPDWNGTAQLDGRMTAPPLAGVIGLDGEEWMIVGFDIGGGERENGHHNLYVYAVDRTLIRDTSDVIKQVAADHGGEIPVTQFLVHNVDPYEILRAITHQFSLHMRSRGTRDWPIRVVALGDVPTQEDPDWVDD